MFKPGDIVRIVKLRGIQNPKKYKDSPIDQIGTILYVQGAGRYRVKLRKEYLGFIYFYADELELMFDV